MPVVSALHAAGGKEEDMKAIPVLLAWALWTAPIARADLLMNVTMDYDQDRDHLSTQNIFGELARGLGKALGQPVKLVVTQNAERVGERVRQAAYDIILAPAQIVGLAMRHDYKPVARSEAETRVFLVSAQASRVNSFENAKGRHIVLPHPESLVSYTIKGELNALGFSPGSYFSQVSHVNRYGAVQYAIDIGQADIAAMRDDLAKDWLSQHPGATVVRTFDATPIAGVAVSGKMADGLRDRVQQAFVGLDAEMVAKLKKTNLSAFDPADTADFEKVSTRGFFTPEILPGAGIVTAEQVRKMMSQGVPLFDVRPESHYREGHIPGAKHVPYQLNSPKEPDYDDSVDKFDLGLLPKDKNTAMIFQCNGAECWYSYKAARYLVKRGYKRVYWFRTGLPAWKAAGYPLQRGA